MSEQLMAKMLELGASRAVEVGNGTFRVVQLADSTLLTLRMGRREREEELRLVAGAIADDAPILRKTEDGFEILDWNYNPQSMIGG
ncbi:MAG: hypothetical protein Q7S01_01715 [bacterium]|nr:hypothetical protein [bacterium]